MQEGFSMSIDKESDIQANLQIGPTSIGMVRIYVEGDGIEIPMDFDPEEADEIAEELKAAANQARNMGGKNKKSRKGRS
jgi:ArsR family metal-binding transcriptional regulator